MTKILFLNSKGISVLFLIIAMLLMVTIGYVFSYLIPTKQRSITFPIYSNQAFFVAQSGVEFAVRYATDNGLATLNGMTRTLGNGRFSLAYDSGADILASVGEAPIGTPRRSIQVSNFTQFLSQGQLVLWIESPTYQAPCWFGGSNLNIRFFIKNTGASAVTINSFSASWSVPPNNRNITKILLGTNTVFSGSYNYSGGTPAVRSFTPLGNTQTINPNQVINVLVTWDRNISGQLPVNFSFYDTTGTLYLFTLQPTENCT